MILLEAVTIEVGSVIAKSILKLWLKDSPVASDASASLIDLLKSRTSDRVAQRRGQRQFDTIGEKVGESLLPVFMMEGAGLEESSRIAVALAVAEVFNKSLLSSEILAERNLEPMKLAKYLLDTNPKEIQHFSEAEGALYQRIIEESCVYIVDIATQLPAFTEHAFGHILKREDQLIAKTVQILQEIHQMQEKLNPMAEAGRFEIDYRRAVVRKLDELQLLGVDISTTSRRHSLSVAYITLSVEQRSLNIPKDMNNALATNTTDIEGSQSESAKNIVSVNEALASSRRLLIRGLAGSGKTTLLQWVAVRSASRSFNGLLSGWNDTVPFFIHLRHCVQSGLPRPETFPSLVAPIIADTMPKGWVHSQLKSGRAIILIDGLDEVAALERENVRIWVKEVVVLYPEARFIITSRPHAVEEGWMDHEDFSSAELQPMQLSDIYSFIDHWHQSVREELHEDEEKAELEPLAEHLKGDVKHNRNIRNLATNPLLCAMLCALNRERRHQLPANRIELYEACCYLLIQLRDETRQIKLADYPIFEYRQKRRLLEDLAYWMIQNDWLEAPLERVDIRFARKIRDMPSISDVSGSDVRRLFVERTGIIREPVTGQIDFTHRTFQEFLAAQAALDEMDIGVLVKNAHNDQWRSVVILAAGLASKGMCEELIKGLIARGDKNKEYRYQLHFLAVSCLETSIELGQEVKTDVEKRLSKLVPPRNMIDAQSLAAAGDLAVKYLARKNEVKESDTVTAACIRTLALIGSDAALEILEEYADDTRSKVIEELMRAWDSFDREIYARQVLSQTFRNSVHLHLENLPSIQGIQYFTNVISLTLTDCSQVTDFAPLRSLTQLSSLDLAGCPKLYTLKLTNLTRLSSLTLSACSQFSSLSLTGLTQLTSLDISNCSQFSSLSLTGLTQLTSLTLTNCSQLSNLSSLSNLTQLT